MEKILITGGRNPTALELVRLLAGKGRQIWLADSLEFPVGRYSFFVHQYLQTPKVAFDPEAFIDFLRNEIIKHKIDLFIPTYEETFCIAQYKSQLDDVCKVFCDDHDKLISLHNKYSFTLKTKDSTIAAPLGHLFNDPSELTAFGEDPQQYVFKPVFSRFATKTLICPDRNQLLHLQNESDYPWMAQKFIKGKEFCSYSIVYDGQVKAHVTYNHSFQLGKGSGIYFHVAHKPEIEKYVAEFCSKHQYHGQIGFDFIEDEVDGKIYVIECNPRTVSGLHLFNQKDHIINAFLGENASLLTPADQIPKMNGLTFCTYSAVKAIKERKFRQWFAAISKAEDVIFRMNDPLPFFGQNLTLLEFFFMMLKYRVNLGDAISHDIAWNGKPAINPKEIIKQKK